jgi:hypothetical protein
VGLKAKLKITTTNKEKNSMELMASLDRHSSRRSLPSVVNVVLKVKLDPLCGRKKMDQVVKHTRASISFRFSQRLHCKGDAHLPTWFPSSINRNESAVPSSNDA